MNVYVSHCIATSLLMLICDPQKLHVFQYIAKEGCSQPTYILFQTIFLMSSRCILCKSKYSVKMTNQVCGYFSKIGITYLQLQPTKHFTVILN